MSVPKNQAFSFDIDIKTLEGADDTSTAITLWTKKDTDANYAVAATQPARIKAPDGVTDSTSVKISLSASEMNGDQIKWLAFGTGLLSQGGTIVTEAVYSAERGANLDSLDATITSRLAAVDYVVPATVTNVTDAQEAIIAAISTDVGIGNGEVTYPYPVTDTSNNPVDGAFVECYSDSARTKRVGYGTTPTNGTINFGLNAPNPDAPTATPNRYYFRVTYNNRSWDDEEDIA